MPPILIRALLLVAYGLDRYVSRRNQEQLQEQLQEQFRQLYQVLAVAFFIVIACIACIACYLVYKQKEQRKHDGLELGIYFASIWDVWTKEQSRDICDVKPSAIQRKKTPEVYSELFLNCGYDKQREWEGGTDDTQHNTKTMLRCGRFKSIFGGPDKSLAHIFPSSWICSWFYGWVAERLVGEADSNNVVTHEQRALRRHSLVHDRKVGLKYLDRNLLPLPKDHDDYFDKCTRDCLLIIPIMDVAAMKAWDGEAYDVLVVASSHEVYKWMKVDAKKLKQGAATPQEARTATEALNAAVTDLLHSLVREGEGEGEGPGPIMDGVKLSVHHSNNRQPDTPSTAAASLDANSSTQESSRKKYKNKNSSLSAGSGNGLKAVEGKIQQLRNTKGKILEKGFPLPELLQNVRKPLLKLSLACLDDVPDPLALAAKAGINWSAFATDGDMKLLTGCRASPPMEGDCDSPETVAEEAFLPTFINVPNKKLARPTARPTTRDRSCSPPHVVSP